MITNYDLVVERVWAFLRTNPILAFAPGLANMLPVFALNIAGARLGGALDTRFRGIIQMYQRRC